MESQETLPAGMNEEADAPMWRRQCARNLMDCYALGMEVLSGSWAKGHPGHAAMDALTRLMVDGMTAARTVEDGKSFYRTAANLCRECAEAAGDKGRLFRVYAAIFEDTGEAMWPESGQQSMRRVA